jgi:pyruvate dehydrogenase (quinone)/pyruvate oxidase
MPIQGNKTNHPQPDSYTLAEAILQQLHIWGVKRIYGVVGDAIFGLLDAIAGQKEIKFIGVKHESIAAMMASAEAKLTGNIGVCIAQMGPGLANLVNGLGDAYLDKAPVLAITGQAPIKKLGTPYKQLINQQELVQAISGYSELVVHPDAAVVALSKAIHTAISMDTVAHLSIPTDLFKQVTNKKPIKQSHKKPCTLSKEQLIEANHVIRMAKSPIILVGNKMRHVKTAIQTLAEQWGAGIVTAYGAIGIFPKSCPCYLGGIGEGGNPDITPLFKQADVILAIGTSWWPEGFTPTDTTIIQVQDCLEKIGEGMPVHIGITGHMDDIIACLTKSHKVDNSWQNKIHDCYQNRVRGQQTKKAQTPLAPSTIVETIAEFVTEDTIIALDEGDSTLWFMENFKETCTNVLLSSKWRTMGFGLPAALAAKLTKPEQHVICIAGDGGLAMALADLVTAIRYDLPITLVVLNNGTLQMEKNKMTVKGLIPEGTNITNPDFVALAKACGWDAHPVQTQEELEKGLRAGQTATKPILLDVQTAQDMYPHYQMN